MYYWHYSYPSGKWFLPVNWTSTRLRVIRSKVYSGVNNLQVKDASGTVCRGEHAWESIKLLRHQPPTHKRVCDLCNRLTNIAHLPFRYKPRDSCQCQSYFQSELTCKCLTVYPELVVVKIIHVYMHMQWWIHYQETKNTKNIIGLHVLSVFLVAFHRFFVIIYDSEYKWI